MKCYSYTKVRGIESTTERVLFKWNCNCLNWYSISHSTVQTKNLWFCYISCYKINFLHLRYFLNWSLVSHSSCTRNKSMTLLLKFGFQGICFCIIMDLYFIYGAQTMDARCLKKIHVQHVVSWTSIIGGLVSFRDMDVVRWPFNQILTRNMWVSFIQS